MAPVGVDPPAIPLTIPGTFTHDQRVHTKREAENYDRDTAEDAHRGRLAKMRPAR